MDSNRPLSHGPRPLRRVLIANRGEIAVRIMRACREMDIATVAVYSDADRAALHVRVADEAIYIGASPPRESYLNIERIIDAAKRTNADAIHPGYGFLAENAEFAQAVNDAGIVFIGPSPFSIRAMGDKAEARTRMIASGVPVVPGFQDADDDASLENAAREIGYPVLIKAAAGGGGKAMRVVKNAQDFSEALAAARREAQHAFGNARVILEKYIENARHIEFQVLADRFGNTIHLFERECSIQRRHQKIIEEIPSPLLDEALREKMGNAAVAAARAVNYENAGTIEFIVNPNSREFYFLEMNTRLQVEHPITEMTTGLDLVQWQIRIASGEQLSVSSNQLSVIGNQSVSSLQSPISIVQQRGHAIECRIYAEDPANHFLPSTGRVLDLELPQLPGVRADSGIARGDEITSFYDPLLLKIIAFAETRDAAIAKMQNALREFVLLGVRTNVEFLQWVLEHGTFREGKATTRFLEEMGDWGDKKHRLETGDWRVETALIAAALLEMLEKKASGVQVSNDNDPYSPWRASSAFRVGAN
jgi:acetyl-CoA carboxylase biotin carboxylase subunit